MMIYPIGIRIGNSRRGRLAGAGFTLVELILVMALLVLLLALVAPSLSKSMTRHNLDQAGDQWLAMTEYCRDEAISQGVPMVMWMNAQTGQFGADAKAGYPGEAGRARVHTLGTDMHFEVSNNPVSNSQTMNAAEFEPDGSLDPSSTYSVAIVDRAQDRLTLAQTADGDGYEIASAPR